MRRKIRGVHVGISGFPFGSAAINKCLSVYNVLSEENIDVLIINNRSRHKKDMPIIINKKGVYGKVSYYYTTPSPYKPEGFIKRRYYNIAGRINEFILLSSLGFKNRIDIIFFYPEANFFELLAYRIFSLLFNIPLVAHYVEYRSEFSNRRRLWIRINDFLFDKFFMFYIDGVFPISEFLINEIKKKKETLPIYKIPPIVDFNLFSKIKKKSSIKYFLYVGNSGYHKALDIILEAFELIENNDFFLYLIISGNKDDIINKINKHSKKKLIKIFSNLTYNELIEYNLNAKALLIPLSNSLQDRARFPQKISEYLASKNPIITTNYGEIRFYFKDEINAFVAEKDTSNLILNKMMFVINNPERAKEIGIKGFETGLKYFDSKAYNASLRKFILNIIDN